MSQQTMEEAGTIRDRSSDSKGYRRRLFLWMLCHPLFLAVYILFCRTAYRFCMYGGVRRRGSILLGCMLFFLLYLVRFLYCCHRVRVKTKNEPGTKADSDKVWFYGLYRRGVYVFDRQYGYTQERLSGKERDFVRLKYAKLPKYRHFFWKVPACIFLLLLTVMTAGGIYSSAQSYRGKLAWVLHDLQRVKYIAFEHDNLYIDGIDGIFYDIKKEMELPEHLTVSGTFHLHFEPDGSIRTFDVLLKGYDRNYDFVDTYLISYPFKEQCIRVEKGNHVNGQEYDAGKDIDALLKGCRVLPFAEAVWDWDGQEEYGILYLGSRTWSRWDENIFRLEKDGSVVPVDWPATDEITGKCISVFCPDDREITAKRYMVSVNSDTEYEGATGQGKNTMQEIERQDEYEEIDTIEKINRYMIPEQSFDIFLEDWGEVTFVSCEPPKPSYCDYDASFFLIRDEQILYKFPYMHEHNKWDDWGCFDSVGAVAFRDIDGDEKKDVIVIAYFCLGVGPTGMVPRPYVRIFLAGEKAFFLAEDMIEEVADHISEQDMTIDNICNFLQDK